MHIIFDCMYFIQRCQDVLLECSLIQIPMSVLVSYNNNNVIIVNNLHIGPGSKGTSLCTERIVNLACRSLRLTQQQVPLPCLP